MARAWTVLALEPERRLTLHCTVDKIARLAEEGGRAKAYRAHHPLAAVTAADQPATDRSHRD